MMKVKFMKTLREFRIIQDFMKIIVMTETTNLYNKVQIKKVIKVIKIEKVIIKIRRNLIQIYINQSINILSQK